MRQFPDVTINKTRFVLPFEQCNFTREKVDTVLLHFTAGSTAYGAAATFQTNGKKVHTPYIVDKDGTIYEMYDPEKIWGYHLGVSDLATEKRCIGIEIVNEGPLKLKDGKLCWWPKDYSTPYTGEAVETEPFRGFTHWAAFPDPQVQAVVALTKELCRRFGIPYLIPNKETRERAHKPAEFPKGICTHQQFRADKVDIGPAWPWEEM